MYLEFSNFLHKSLLKIDFKQIIGKNPESENKLQEIISRSQSVIVESAPKHIEAELTSALAFFLSEQLNKNFASAINPRDVGLLIAEQVRTLSDRDNFKLDIGTSGHINGDSSESCRREFIKIVEERGSSVLLSRNSVFSKTANSEQNIFPKLSVDLMLADKKNRKRGDSDLNKLFSLIASEQACDSDFLMFFGALAEQELESGPYLEKLQTSQNLPWYVDNFFKDIKRILSNHSPKSLVDLNEGQREALARLESKLEDFLCEFRGLYSLSLLMGSPEIVIGRSVVLIKDFYSFYNRPGLRNVFFEPEKSGRSRRLLEISSDLILQVVSGFSVSRQPAPRP